jgi:primosomal protein N' (replication factor Y)
VVRVLPDVAAIDKEFDYLLAPGTEVRLGDVVRIVLHGRRVGGWIVALDVAPEPDVTLKVLARVTGRGPAPELIDLARWAAWRWAGRRASFLRTAAPPGVVTRLPGEAGGEAVAGTTRSPPSSAVTDALALHRAVLRLAPGADRYPLVRAAVSAPSPVLGGHTLVLCPSVAEARVLGTRLRRDGVTVSVMAHDRPGAAAAGDWARAAAGAVVVGARAAAWAPVSPLGRVVVFDEHDEAYQQQQAPTWHARDVVIERAARTGAPCLLVSPCPTLEALGWGELVTTSRANERAGWPRAHVVDQRDLDPTLGPLFSPVLVEMIRRPGRLLCILNRTGRARLLACGACRTLARCEVCDAAVGQTRPSDRAGVSDEIAGSEGVGADGRGPEADRLSCGRCGAERPMVCLACGGNRFKNLRLGVSRAREELEALVGEAVAEVSGVTDVADPDVASARILLGTEALLHRVPRAEAVAFLDMDQELLAVRYRATEQALALLARAARVVRRGSGDDGRILVQTRTPDHPAVMAARHADPGRVVEGELPMRRALGLPPSMAMAVVSGPSAPVFMEAFGGPAGVTIQGPVDGTWRLRAPDHRTLCDSLAATPRPPGRLRIEVDPLDA